MKWTRRMVQNFLLPIGIVILAQGCGTFFGGTVDPGIRDLTAQVEGSPHKGPIDSLPATMRSGSLSPPRIPATVPASPADPELRPVSFIQKDADGTRPTPEDVAPKRKRTLTIPPNLPGANASRIQTPRSAEERGKLYPPIPALPPLAPPAPGPDGKPLGLSNLQSLAYLYSPAIKSAIAAIEAAKGGAKQAGMYPNPTIAFEHDTVETGPAGYPGFYVDQLIKTGGKLTVAQAASTMDVLNAKLALRRSQSDVRTQVRGFYFAHLVAQENMKVSEALFTFTDEIYRTQVALVGIGKGGFAAAYEPLQLRPLVLQARFNLTSARNQYVASWRQLVAAIGLPDMPISEVEGRVDMPVPVFTYAELLARLDGHTDVLTALVSLQKAKYILQQAKLVPLPDVDVRLLVQKDYSTPPNQVSHSFQVSVPIPVWDQNRGGVHQAKWLLTQATVGPAQSCNALVGTLADAFNRYETAVENAQLAMQQIQDQVRAYRGVYDRRNAVPGDVSFGDVVNAQQTLVAYVSGYITALGLQWQAVVDIANLMQTEDLFQAGPRQQMEPLPDLRYLPPLPKHLPVPPAGETTSFCLPHVIYLHGPTAAIALVGVSDQAQKPGSPTPAMPASAPPTLPALRLLSAEGRPDPKGSAP